MADDQIRASETAAAPLNYLIPGAAEIILKTLRATYDGSGAAGPFLPAVEIIAPGGATCGLFPVDTTLTVGATADVTWAPFLGRGAGGAAVASSQVIYLDTADAAGNGYPVLSTRFGFANNRRVMPAFLEAVDGSWVGAIVVPANYFADPIVTLSFVANAVAGVVRTNVETSVVAAGASEDTALTAEAFVNTTVPATANERFDVSYSLTTAPAANATLNVQVNRQGTSGSDTLATSLLLASVIFTYTAS